MEELISKIGQNEENDYILDLEAHQNLYRSSLPKLYDILSSSELSTFASEYQTFDQQAIDAQKLYKTNTKRSRIFTFLTALFSSLLIVAGGINLDSTLGNEAAKYIVVILSLLGAASSALVTVYLVLIRDGKLLLKWMEKRAMAEEYRLLYFDKVTQLPEEIQEEEKVEQSLIRLEYFRRFQLNIQRNYYSNRSSQLSKRGNQAIINAAWIAGGVAFLDGLASAFGLVEEDLAWVILGGLALVGTAVGSMITNRELTEQNQRNALRYDNTRSVLVRLYARLDQVREGIQKGKVELLGRFVKAVHEPLSNEHRQWLENMGKTHSAIGELEELLG